MKIAVFADIHGKILLPFKMVDAYQKQYGEKIDLILQCGDIGAFPDIENMDKATIKHAKRDRQELGFSQQFVYINREIEAFLNKLDINMICVRGNHEDHDFLDTKEAQSAESCFPIDCYHRVYVCKSGMLQRFVAEDGEDLDFMGIGRIGDRKNRNEKRFIQEYEKRNINKSIKLGKRLDILISHDVSEDMTSPGFGMEELRPVLNRLKPLVHFYGHTGEAFKVERDINNITSSVKVKELEFDKAGFLPHGCMVILDKKGGIIEDEPINVDFMRQFTKQTWDL
ncbi:MAG: metallophosphoesterase [Dysgonomonas sp.]|nr:metallophosphoesterase [Dysgonomonas sp.]